MLANGVCADSALCFSFQLLLISAFFSPLVLLLLPFFASVNGVGFWIPSLRLQIDCLFPFRGTSHW